MNKKIAYALLQEIPFPRLMLLLKNATVDPPESFEEATDAVCQAAAEDDVLLRDIARLTITIPAIASGIAQQTPLKTIGTMPGFGAARQIGESIGKNILQAAGNIAAEKNIRLAKFIEILKEELEESQK